MKKYASKILAGAIALAMVLGNSVYFTAHVLPRI